MSRKTLKLAIVAAEKKYQVLATEANAKLAPEHWLSEHDITRLVTCRKEPTKKQASALARVLRQSVSELFPVGGKA